MRLTLEQLKGMSAARVKTVWDNSEFPFDSMDGCRLCLTQHSTITFFCEHKNHAEIKKNIQVMGQDNSAEFLKGHLEELYALRLFYDSLYPQQKTEIAIETEKEKVECVTQS